MLFEKVVVKDTSLLVVVERGVVDGGNGVRYNGFSVNVRTEHLVLDEKVIVVHGQLGIGEFRDCHHLLGVVHVKAVDIEPLQAEIGLVEGGHILLHSLHGEIGSGDQQNDIVHLISIVVERV